MIIDTPSCDWLTLTTFDQSKFQLCRQDWLSWREKMARVQNSARGLSPSDAAYQTVPVRRSRVMQYDGSTVDGVFFGAGFQAGKEHFYIRASGEIAQYFAMNKDYMGDMTCKRVDCQVTVSLDGDYDAHELANQLDGAEWKGRHPLIKERLCRKTKLDTVYVGSRQSPKFLRIYVKEDLEGKRYLRFELEFSRRLSQKVWREMVQGTVGTVCAEYICASLRKMPDVKMLQPFSVWRTAVNPASMYTGERVKTANGTLDWLHGSVTPALRKLLSNDDTRQAAIDWFVSIREMSEDFSNA